MVGVVEIRTRLTAHSPPLPPNSQPSHGAEQKWGLVRFPVWPGSKLLFHGEVLPLLSPKHYNHLTKTWAFAQIKTSIMHKCFSVLSCSISGLGWKTLSTFCTFSTSRKTLAAISCPARGAGRVGSCGTQASVIRATWYEAVVVMGTLVCCWFCIKSAEWSDASFLQTTKTGA